MITQSGQEIMSVELHVGSRSIFADAILGGQSSDPPPGRDAHRLLALAPGRTVRGKRLARSGPEPKASAAQVRA